MDPRPAMNRRPSMQELPRIRRTTGSTRASIGRDDDEWAFSPLPQNAAAPREAQPHADHYAYDAKSKRWRRRTAKVSPMNLVEEISVSRMNERRRRCSDAAATYWRKVIRGVDQAENPMMRRARQEETFPRGTWRFNPRGACFSAWSVTMIPFLCYVALVTPFEIAFISSDATLFYINLVVDIYFLVDLLVNFNLAFYDRERDRWVLHLWPIAVQYIKGWFFLDLISVAFRSRRL